MFNSILSTFIKPLGLSIAVLLIFGGPNFYRNFEKLFANTSHTTDERSFRSWLSNVYLAQSELLRITWKATAPVVFCNEFAIGWNSKSKSCPNKASSDP